MEKIRLHSYTYGCFLVLGAKVVQFLSIKTSIPCIFYSCLNFYWKKGRGDFWRPQFALWRPKIYSWSPVGASIKKLISDPVPVYLFGPLEFSNSFFPSTFSLSLFTAEVSAESYVRAELASVTAATSLSQFHLATPSSKKAWKCRSFALVP